MQVLILGGTGAIGRYLIDILKEDHDVYVSSRSTHADGSHVHFLKGNALDDDFLKCILGKNQPWDIIVDFMNYSTEQFRKRYQYLLRSSKQYIYLSSARVYADTNGRAIKEECARLLDVCQDVQYLSTDEYALRKARQEDLLLNSNMRHFTIIRPYITYSEERLQLGTFEKEMWLWRAMHGNTIIFPLDIAEKSTTMTHGKDVARGIASLIGNQGAYGETIHITSNDVVTWNEILDIYVKTLNQKCDISLKVKYIDELSDLPTSLYESRQYQYDRLYNRRFNNSKFEKISGMRVAEFGKTDIELQKCVEKFIDSKKNVIHYPSADACFDKLCEERLALNQFKNLKDKLKYLLLRNIK